MCEYTKVEGKEICDIKVYALSTCIWCKKAKTFLESNNIAYSFIFVDLQPKEDQDKIEDMLEEHTSIISYPIIISDKCDPIIGYNKDKLEELIGTKDE